MQMAGCVSLPSLIPPPIVFEGKSFRPPELEGFFLFFGKRNNVFLTNKINNQKNKQKIFLDGN
jgi:hypothetical protein